MKYYNLKEQFSIFIYFKTMYSCDGKAEFSASLLQCRMILQKFVLIYY